MEGEEQDAEEEEENDPAWGDEMLGWHRRMRIRVMMMMPLMMMMTINCADSKATTNRYGRTTRIPVGCILHFFNSTRSQGCIGRSPVASFLPCGHKEAQARNKQSG